MNPNEDLNPDEAERPGGLEPTQDDSGEPDVTPGLPAASGTRLPVFLPPILRAEASDAPPPPSPRSGLARYAIAAAAAIGIVGAVSAFALLASDRSRQANILAERTNETQALAKTVSALTARLNAIEGARPRDELVELRRSVGELKSNVASSRELSGALAQLSQKVEKLDHEASAKVDRLSERVDHDASARSAELSALIDKLQKKAAVVAAATAPAPAPSQTKPAVPPKFGPNISMETMGSIDRRRPVIPGYVVLGAKDQVALVGGRYGERAVRPGDVLPGAGRVQRIEREGNDWVVMTDQGVIAAAEPPPD